jgi:uncharacterized protein
MKILVERLTETPTAFAFQADSGWWRAAMPSHRKLPGELEAPFEIQLQAHRMAGDELYLEGRLQGTLLLECGRCLARYRHGLREPFRLVLEFAGDRVPADPQEGEALARDGVCLGEDIEVGWYRGPEIDLGTFFYEVVALALPVKPLCREECAGLCSRCGADQNLAPCGCSEIETDSPFAVLGALRDGLTRGED